MKIDASVLYKALSTINRITPYLIGPSDTVVVDVSYAKMRVASSVQLWQVKADGLPDMQLVSEKADYLESLTEGLEGTIGFDATDSHFLFNFEHFTVKLAKPTNIVYDNIEEVFLKPTLVNDSILSVPVVEFRAAMSRIVEGVNPKSVGLQLTSEGVTLTGRDWFDNEVTFTICGTYDGKDLAVAFSATELSTLANLLEDDVTTLRFSAGTKTRPGALLALDTKSGLTVVLPPRKI